MKVLLVGPKDALPEGVSEELSRHEWAVETASDYTSAADKARSKRFDAVVTAAPKANARTTEEPFRSLLRYLDLQRTATVVVGTEETELPVGPSSLIEPVEHGAGGGEIARRLGTLARYQNHVRRMEEELEHLQRLGKSLNEHFQHVDEEMRLAASLQRDFFPRSLELIGPLHIASLNRPASWVSGDAYDVFRVDERHVAFYVADVVGHGVAAGLLTMFIKHAVVGKRVTGHSYEVLEPGETLRRLNDALRQHTLPKCQFVTAAYCLINTETLVMKYARGGHPYPILIDRDGRSTELKATGGLMGLFDPANFATEQVQLHPGEKVVLYSDGLEAPLEANSPESDQSWRGHRAIFELLSRSSATEMIARLNELLDARRRTDLPADDTTVVIAEVSHEDSSTTSPPSPSSVG